MHPLRALVLYVLLVFLGGALLAPWLYWGMHGLSQNFPALADLASSPFHRYLNRALLGLALLGIWPLLKQIDAARLQDVGLSRPRGQLKNTACGFTLGFASLALTASFAFAFGARCINPVLTGGQVAERLAGATLTAVVVAILEEVLFRGVLFGSLQKVFHWIHALVLSSMFYAIVHFMESARATGLVTWMSGFELLPRMLRGFIDVNAVVPAFFNLTLAGMLLGVAYRRTGTLYFSIGLHAGWIFCLKAYESITRAVPDASVALWGGDKLVNGWMTLPILAATLLVFTGFRMSRTVRRHPAEQSP